MVHKLGGVGFMPSGDEYGDQSRVVVRFPKLGTSVKSEGLLKHPDELAPSESDMDPAGWNFIAMTAIHQGSSTCSIDNCKACNFQPEAAEQPNAPSHTRPETSEEMTCDGCLAVHNGKQIVCPQHSPASTCFLMHADTEAHLTMADPSTEENSGNIDELLEEMRPPKSVASKRGKRLTAKRVKPRKQAKPHVADTATEKPSEESDTGWTDVEWNKLSPEKQASERQKAGDEIRDKFLDANLSSDIPQATFTGSIHQGGTAVSDEHEASFIYDGSLKANLMSTAMAAKFITTAATPVWIDTARGPCQSTRTASVCVEFQGGRRSHEAEFRVVEGLKHDAVLSTRFKADAGMTISFTSSTISFADLGPAANIKFEPTNGRHWRRLAQLRAVADSKIMPGKALIAVKSSRNRNLYSTDHGLVYDAIGSIDIEQDESEGLQLTVPQSVVTRPEWIEVHNFTNKPIILKRDTSTSHI
jgi:hypothetical protein